MTKHSALCAGSFVCLMVYGLYQFTVAATHPDGLAMPSGIKNFRDGVTTQAIEKALDLKLPARDTVIAFANTIRYQLFGASGDQVRTGNNGWLFLTDEIKFEGISAGQSLLNDPSTSIQQRTEFIAAIAKRLQAQGVTLVVALVPDKARVYQTQLKSQSYPADNANKYGNVLKQLQRRQVHVVDLLEPFNQAAKVNQSKEVYYRTDTHWNQNGAQIAAAQIAIHIKKLAIPLEPTQFQTTVASNSTERVGDLIRLMGLGIVPSALRPSPDTEAVAATTEIRKGVDKNSSAGLFGDASVSVALVGTSYSLRGNFHGYLQEALATKILNTAKDGGGFLQALTAYVQDDAFKSSKPKVIVWEIPERMMASPLTEEGTWLQKHLQ